MPSGCRQEGDTQGAQEAFERGLVPRAYAMAVYRGYPLVSGIVLKSLSFTKSKKIVMQ